MAPRLSPPKYLRNGCSVKPLLQRDCYPTVDCACTTSAFDSDDTSSGIAAQRWPGILPARAHETDGQRQVTLQSQRTRRIAIAIDTDGAVRAGRQARTVIDRAPNRPSHT
ncbi:MAG: hypothetical protein AMXMBFR25_18650 [Lysobacterales bacterium]